MATISFKYVVPDSHTFIRTSENEPKVKVVTGEIVEIKDGFYDRARMFLAGFREIGEDGKLLTSKSNDAVVAENAKKAAKEAKAAEKEAEKVEKEAEKIEEGNVVPSIVVPMQGAGEAKAASVDYSTLKQPELKAELEKRGLEVPKGIVSNATLIETLVENDGSKDITITVTQ